MADGSIPSFKAADLVIQLSSALQTKPDVTGFGSVFTDHMLTIEWSATEGWQAPHIKPFGNLSLHPACSSLHYGIQLFEGLKVYRGDDHQLRLFRPTLNLDRMANSAKRACLPAFDQSELLGCIRRLIEIEQDWIPHSGPASLYIRPTFIGTEPTLGLKKPAHALLYVILSQAGSYFNNEAEGLSLWADPKYTRAWKGGTGDCKMGGNYGCSLSAQYEAVDYGCQQDEFKVTERYLTMGQLCSALKQQRVKEMFGSGTACVICPVGHIVYQGENGRTTSDWTLLV
ncbi:hypothetical protein F2P81_018659 [Scophthalmus maximus]|uniref:branched-chain-amino-acid transaminase n=1 Tax=Scophthalmus maximus TaxID=52904 RepID=A0A6A4SF81_SCOMX|nr:hypothetical protein F2P81_018659 [Scophthalmus maximus]